jgi:5-methyltetrahydrofolate--homocysteine methyltransferase
MSSRKILDEIAKDRILILDGAMGTMIQGFNLTEKDFRGSRFASHPVSLLGCNDILCLTRPDVIEHIHRTYLEAGADIIESCSFNSTAVSLGDYGLAGIAYEINVAAARIARRAADAFSTADKPRFVAGSIGPTAKSASISPDINDLSKRSITFDELVTAYYDNARGLLDGGADILLIETVFDTLNAKAAIFAIDSLKEERQVDIPLMISATIADISGHILSGQTLAAFSASILHGNPWALGLNCSFGADKLEPYIREMADLAPCLVSAYPNAGLPNRLGKYDETPEIMAACLEGYMRQNLVNIVGGCCGSTPAHIAAIAEKARCYPPRKKPHTRKTPGVQKTSGAIFDAPMGTLALIGERTNVAGSRKFLKFIKEEKYDEAISIAQNMIEKGASGIDVCMDDAMLDAKTSMTRFLGLGLTYPDFAQTTIMVDSSRWEVIEAALKCIQGKSLVNSINIKEGKDEFLRKARLAHRYGAAVVVMLFDEQGQAATYERKIAIAGRSYVLLTGNGFPPEDIIFDPNVLSIATGIPEHDHYALDFINTCAWIREHCPGVNIIGGIANLSFSFRGNNLVRETMHTVFLKHAIDAGLTMAILNPVTMIPYDDLDPELRQAAEDVILCRKPAAMPGNRNAAGVSGNEPDNAVERLLALALEIKAREQQPGNTAKSPLIEQADSWRSLNAEERIVHAMIKGIDAFIREDVLELRPKYSRSLELIEGPFMKGMKEVGELFGAGKMFLPQVIRSAQVMKKGVAALEPFIEKEKAEAAKTNVTEDTHSQSHEDKTSVGEATILLATVRGDVHDIGKNIVGVVLGCNGYKIVDLGVMIPPEQIIDTAIRKNVHIIGLSGLITPSLDEMIRVAQEMKKRDLRIPLLIGGAAASLAHTALRIAPEYSGPVVYVPDASRSAETVRNLLSETEKPRFLEKLEQQYKEAAERHESLQTRLELLPLEKARENRTFVSAPAPEPRIKTIVELNNYPPARIIPFINWSIFLYEWDIGKKKDHNVSTKEEEQVRQKLLEDAQIMLNEIISKKILTLRGVLGFFPALAHGDDIALYELAADTELKRPANKKELARFFFLRNQEKKRAGGSNTCLADFVLSGEQGDKAGCTDWLGLFVLSAGFGMAEAEAAFKMKNDNYQALILATLANTLAEAFSAEVHHQVAKEYWGYNQAASTGAPNRGIRPAFGYPSCPDHEDKRIAFDLLEAEKRCGFGLTETAMIVPTASVCGMYFAHPEAHYFGISDVGEDQLIDWASRKRINREEARRRIKHI